MNFFAALFSVPAVDEQLYSLSFVRLHLSFERSMLRVVKSVYKIHKERVCSMPSSVETEHSCSIVS